MFDILYFLFIALYILFSLGNMLAPRFMWSKTDVFKRVSEPSELYLVYRRIISAMAFVAGVVYFLVPLLDRW